MTAVETWEPLELALNETQAICELLTGDPIHRRDRDAVVAAIKDCADRNGGLVDPNLVRVLIPSWVFCRVIPAVYSGLKARGVLVRAGTGVNEDHKGRNVGKESRLYRWTA